jgi:GntR family transcriptional regulator/MocR family aminotransferase
MSASFPHDEWSRCLRRARGTPRYAVIVPSTIPRCRKPCSGISRFIAGVKAAASQILFVPTAQAGLMLIANALLEPGDRAWVESPGYGGADRRLPGGWRRRLRHPARPARMAISSHKETPR